MLKRKESRKTRREQKRDYALHCSLRLCLRVWRGGKGKILKVGNIRENDKIFHIF